jgi:hypothetical protein
MSAADGNAEPMVSIAVDAARSAPPGERALLGWGGGVWNVPEIFPVVAEQVFASGVGLGSVRACLSSEVLIPSRDLEDLEQRLERHPLNGFLREFHRRGGSVMICLDAMPRWLASTPAGDGDGRAERPGFALSPPRDAERWARVVEAVVRHFNGRLGLDADYEIWNEPNAASYWSGTFEQYCELYRASVAGARRADPSARVGGPAVAEWSAPVRGERAADRTFLREFLLWTARNRVSLDFVTWHGFYRDPGQHYHAVVPRVRRWLADAGHAERTPLVVSEWNLGVAPPYPEGDLNATHVGAAFVGATLLAMREAGIQRQIFQMMVDPGGRGYSGGTFTAFGLPRSSFDAFRMFSELRGHAVESRSSDPWVHSIAFADDRQLTLLIAVFAPTERLLMRLAGDESFAADPDQPRPAASPQAFEDYLRGGALPRSIEGPAAASLARMRERFQRDAGRLRAWQEPIALDVRVNGLGFDPAGVTHGSIDSVNQVSAEDVERAAHQLAEVARGGPPTGAALDRYGAEVAKIAGRLRSRGGPRPLAGERAPLTLRVAPQSLHLLVFPRR